MGKRNYIIDLLRFLFSVMIVIHHSSNMFGELRFAPSGYLGVEFFFIVAGYYMMSYIERVQKNKSICEIDAGIETRKFVFKKVKKMLPYMFFSIVSALIVLYIYAGQRDISWAILYSFSDLLMVQMAGFPGNWPTGASWFLSAMFLSFMVLFPLALKKKSMYINVIAPFGAIMILGHIARTFGSIGSDPGLWMNYFAKGFMGALAEISIGAVIYYVCIEIKEKKWNKVYVILASVMEIFCYLGVAYMAYKYQPCSMDLIAIMLLIIGMTITFSEKTIWIRICNWKIFGGLGKLSA